MYPLMLRPDVTICGYLCFYWLIGLASKKASIRNATIRNASGIVVHPFLMGILRNTGKF
jgi:hypothetical protein